MSNVKLIVKVIEFISDLFVVHCCTFVKNLYRLLTKNVSFLPLGNNNVENLANSLKMVQNSVAHLTDDTQTLRNKTLMLEFREAVIRIIAAYYTNQSCSGIFYYCLAS